MNETIEEWYNQHEVELRDLKNVFWSHPEIAFREFYSAKKTAEYLRDNGFVDVREFDAEEKGNEPNTVIAHYGSGSPVIGILGEYDALPGLGQEAVPYYSPIEGPGHGCGHCLMVTASVSAAVALKKVIDEEKLKGTLVFIACPAEETLAGKAVLARDGYFDELDAAIIWHPGASAPRFNDGEELSATTNILYTFKGKTSHAANAWDGRSALDAAQLMNLGVEFLREHIPQDARVHYVFKQAGEAPNIVPENASVYYFIRSNEEHNDDLVRRVNQIAEAAALMTETSVESYVEAGCHSYRPSRTLNKYGYEAVKKIPEIKYSEEDYEFARELIRNISGEEPPLELEKLLPKKINEPEHTPKFIGGSTDVGDVAMVCPTIQLGGFGGVIGSPGHHWSITAAAGTEIGTKAAIQGGKMIAQLAYDTFTNPNIISEAKVEFAKDYTKPYKSKIPKN